MLPPVLVVVVDPPEAPAVAGVDEVVPAAPPLPEATTAPPVEVTPPDPLRAASGGVFEGPESEEQAARAITRNSVDQIEREVLGKRQCILMPRIVASWRVSRNCYEDPLTVISLWPRPIVGDVHAVGRTGPAAFRAVSSSVVS